MFNNLRLKVFFLLTIGLFYQTSKSSLNGIFNGGTSCGSCHGSVNSNTTVTLMGLPTTYETNKTYNLSFSVSNATNLKAGFNILVTKGTLTAGTGSVVNTAKTQITHTGPMVATGTTCTFNFTWKAPATTTAITFKAVGNAVNGNNRDDSGDQWNSLSQVISGMFPAGIQSNEPVSVSCYPNPAHEKIMVDGISPEVTNVRLMNLSGQIFTPVFHVENKHLIIDCSSLVKGIYILSCEEQGKQFNSRFIKD